MKDLPMGISEPVWALDIALEKIGHSQIKNYSSKEKYMKRILILCILLLLQDIVHAQREYAICDSTTYLLNTDTSIIAGRRHLYVWANNVLSPLFDFSNSDTNQYIRDFDIVKADLWYTVIGSRYIGSPTQLYKSTNRGMSWMIDTNHWNASNTQMVSTQFLKSINNLQHLNGDTLMMFMHYYESGILYSTDLGQTWTKWFDNLITHYQGMFKCHNRYYIFGYQGDAFRPWMFGFDQSLLFTSDSAGMWNSFSNIGYHPRCSLQNDTLNCIYPPPNVTRCGSYQFFKNYLDTNCWPLGVTDLADEALNVFPNPADRILYIQGLDASHQSISITDLFGIQYSVLPVPFSGKTTLLDINHLKPGIYILSYSKGGRTGHIKFVKN
jgi:hypothetical protein